MSHSSFNLSLAVLVHYRSESVFSLTQRSGWIPTGFRVSRGTQDTPRGKFDVAYTAITFFGDLFRDLLLPNLLPHWSPTTPRPNFLSKECWRGLGSSAFAHRYLRNHFVLFSSGYLDVSVPRVPSFILIIRPKAKTWDKSDW